jgi:UDP-glucose 4-epimerase
MHVLITGGAGFIGSHLADLHIFRGDKVHVVDNLSTGSRANLTRHARNKNLHASFEDIRSWDGLDNAVAWADRVYHLAAVVGVKRVLENPVRVLATNVSGTERLLEAIHKGGWNPTCIVASSSEVYGCNPDASFDELSGLTFRSGSPLRWTYAVTKLVDEFYAMSHQRYYSQNICVTRLFNTIGPRQVGTYGMVVPTFVHQAINDLPITVYGDGRQTRSFCDVRDTIRALDALASSESCAGQIVNVGNDREVSIGELAELVKQRTGSHSRIEHLDYSRAYGQEYDDIRHRRPDLSRLRELTGFEPEWSLEETIDDLVQVSRQSATKGV